MANWYAQKGSTSLGVPFVVRNSSTGQGLESKIATDFSGGYNKGNSATVALSFSDASMGDAYGSGKIAESSLGGYFYHLSDTILNTNGFVQLRIACSGGLLTTITIQVGEMDIEDAVRLGLTALPSVNAGVENGLPILDSNTRIASQVGGMDADVLTAAAIADDAFSSEHFADNALDGAGDWNTTTPLDATGVRAALGMTGATFDSDISGMVSDLATLKTRLTSARAGHLDNLNTGGVVATQSDIDNINQSASRRLLITSVKQFERPESASSDYTIQSRTYTGDGVLVNADTTPSLTVTGGTSGDLSSHLSVASNPSTGVYQWTYTVEDDATLEEVLFGISATINSDVHTLTHITQVADFVAATFTTADRTLLTDAKEAAEAVELKLPSKAYLAGSADADGGFDSESKADINAEADQALADYDGLTRTEATTDKNEILTDIAEVKADTGNLITRIPSTLFSGITSIASWFGISLGKTADAATLAEVNATTAGAGYDNVTMSLEASKDEHDTTQASTGITEQQVKTQVVEALNTDTYSEPGQEAPSASSSIAEKIGYLYKAWRNKTEQTSSEYKLYDNAGSTVDQKATVSDDGNTTTVGEVGSGP